MTSTSFNFITILSINQNLPLQELIQLKKLKNLGVLHIMYIETQGESYVSDRLVRAWSNAAVTEGAFPVLRVLNLWGHRDVTLQSLNFANKFPALCLFHIRQWHLSYDFGTKDQANDRAVSLGWKCE